jgi:hypothetical protein
MTDMKISMPDAHAARFIEALAARQGWTPDSGEPQGKWAKANVMDYMTTVTKHYEAERDANAARKAALDASEKDLVLS